MSNCSLRQSRSTLAQTWSQRQLAGPRHHYERDKDLSGRGDAVHRSRDSSRGLCQRRLPPNRASAISDPACGGNSSPGERATAGRSVLCLSPAFTALIALPGNGRGREAYA